MPETVDFITKTKPMKKILVKKLSDLFNPNAYLELNVYDVLDGLKDDVVRKHWLFEVLQEIKRINVSIDQMLDSGHIESIKNLSARRRGLQFVLETAIEQKNAVSRGRGHNPLGEGQFDLESVTVGPAK